MVRFSIVLTTTDRPELLPAAVRAVLEMEFQDFELLVSDNFSRIPAAKILADVQDKRLRIIRTDRRLPVTDHWEFVWEYIRGEYVMYLGDDNALHPTILTFADRAIRDYDLDILSWRVCLYFHPDWDIEYEALPNQGNILGFDPGTTHQLYECRSEAVLKKFCSDIRASGCFPCMLNFLFRKSAADMIRKRTGRLFWAPNPDISSSYLMLGVIRPGRYAFFDGFGGIGGRSRNSNLASLLSRGKASTKAREYVTEFRGQDLLPLHEPKFVAMANSLAATISQAKTLMPDYFKRFDFDRTKLARETIDDIYVHRNQPWIDDLDFLAEVDRFIDSLPAADAIEVFRYRDERLAEVQKSNNAGPGGKNYVRNYEEARVSLLDFWQKADSKDKAFAWRLFRETGRNPLGRYWNFGVTTYVDMALFGGRDIADAARKLPHILAAFDRDRGQFADYYEQIGILGKVLGAEPQECSSATVAESMVEAL
ncbi:MAG TPA: glycosyltransferase [Xanthobacteraceae bacterium]|nr:glycosyltransferase [Xanthobacteraceae bacterium]